MEQIRRNREARARGESYEIEDPVTNDAARSLIVE